MKENGEPETEFEAAMPLFGALVEQSVRDLQWTNDQLLANAEGRLRDLQKDYVRLYNSLVKVSNKTDSHTGFTALDRHYYQYNEACKALNVVTKDAYNEWPDN